MRIITFINCDYNRNICDFYGMYFIDVLYTNTTINRSYELLNKTLRPKL